MSIEKNPDKLSPIDLKLGITMRTSMGWFFYPTSTNILDNFVDISMHN